VESFDSPLSPVFDNISEMDVGYWLRGRFLVYEPLQTKKERAATL